MTAASAGNANSLLTIDLTQGLVAQYLATTQGIAWGLYIFCLCLALLVEAFGKSPGAPRDFGGVVFRAAVVLVLLTFYGKLFGSLFGLAEGIAHRVAPHDVWGRFASAQHKWLNAVAEETTKSGESVFPGVLSGYFFDSLVALALLLGQASLWIINTFGRVLAALLYVLGPLALVFSVPRGVDSGHRWFRVFVSVLCWPVLSGLLVSLTVNFAMQGTGGTVGASAAFESVALAGLMAIIAFAVPLVASSMVGGGLGALSGGWESVAAWSGPALTTLTGTGGSVAGAAKNLPPRMPRLQGARGAGGGRVPRAAAQQNGGA